MLLLWHFYALIPCSLASFNHLFIETRFSKITHKLGLSSFSVDYIWDENTCWFGYINVLKKRNQTVGQSHSVAHSLPIEKTCGSHFIGMYLSEQRTESLIVDSGVWII